MGKSRGTRMKIKKTYQFSSLENQYFFNVERKKHDPFTIMYLKIHAILLKISQGPVVQLVVKLTIWLYFTIGQRFNHGLVNQGLKMSFLTSFNHLVK